MKNHDSKPFAEGNAAAPLDVQTSPSIAQLMRATEASTSEIVARYTEALERSAVGVTDAKPCGS
jgi:hypothetical protein